MNKFFFISILFLMIASCSSLKKGLGIEKDIPDEFLIKKIDPIERPPNFDLLPPDTQDKKTKFNKTKSLKDIIDKNIKDEKTVDNQELNTGVSENLEDEMLKKIKKND